MSGPPPPGGAGRTQTIELESGRRRGPRDALRLSSQGAVLGAGEPAAGAQRPPAGGAEGVLAQRLRLPVGRLQIGLVDRGAARTSGPIGRFAVLRRLSATA